APTELAGNAFEQQQICTGGLERLGILHHRPRGFLTASLHAKATGLVHRLRFQSQVRAHGDVMARKIGHRIELTRPTLELYDARPALLQQTHRVAQRQLGGRIAHERQIGDEQRSHQSAGHRRTVVDHVIHRHRHGRIATQDHHAERISHQHHIDAGGVDQRRKTGVVGREAGDPLALLLHLRQRAEGHRGAVGVPVLQMGIHEASMSQRLPPGNRRASAWGNPDLRRGYSDRPTDSIAIYRNMDAVTEPMAASALIETLPELVVLVRRDGVILSLSAGQGMAPLGQSQAAMQDCAGKALEAVWPQPLATLLRQLTRKAIAQRAPVEAPFEQSGRNYDVRVSAQGPDRAICVIREVLTAPAAEALDLTEERRAPRLDRRSFLRRFRESVSLATLRERSVCVAVIYIDGIADIGQLIDAQLSDEIMNTAIFRLAALNAADADAAGPRCCLGQLSDACLALFLETADQATISACVGELCTSLREPIAAGGSEFHLTPYAGVAVMNETSVAAKTLLARAQSAASEARRAGTEQLVYFNDSGSLESLTQFDIARELHDAIQSHDIRLRYVPRHDLSSGALVAQVGYLRWM